MNDPKYPKPKILLIDLEEEIESKLKTSGYNISTGSFGSPYKVNKEDKYNFIYSDAEMPTVRDQEIFILDQHIKKILDTKPMRKITREGDTDIRVRHIHGVVDPRPILMNFAKTDLAAVWKNGGIFIVFSDQEIFHEYVVSRKGVYGWQNENDFEKNLWSFLPFLTDKNIQKIENHGTEFKFPEKPKMLSRLVEKYLPDSEYSVTFTIDYLFRDNFIPFLLSKFGEVVGSVITTNGKSVLIVLPQIKRKLDLITDLLENVLPNINSDLFPYHEGKIWQNNSSYDLHPVTNLKTEREKIISEKDELVSAIDQLIIKEKEKYSFLYKVLTETGNELVSAVEELLTFLKFKKVINVDKKIAEKDILQPKQEDLQILDNSTSLLVEVKGIIGLPREEDTFQVVKYISRRMKEWDKRDVKGLVIVNHKKNLPPLTRDINPFTPQQINDAKHNDFALLTTWDLFLLIKGMLRNNWHEDYISKKFYESGLITKIPSHYKYVGHIEKFWDKHSAVGIRLEHDKIVKGDTIGFVTENDYLEQKVESLQVDRTDREEAIIDELAGIKTMLPKEILKKGIAVYKIIN